MPARRSILPARVRVLLTALLVVALSASAAVVAPSASAAATYSISGTVRLGAASAVPAAAEVSVEYRLTSQWWATPSSVSVDGAGNYTIPDLAPGSYEIYFRYAGAGAYSSTYYNQGAEVGSTVFYPVTVGSANVTGINDTLEDQGTITGVVSLGSAGTTAAAGEVMVYYQVYTGNQWSGLSTGVATGAGGTFTLSKLVFDQYRLHFVYGGSGQFQSQYFGGGFTAASATMITVDAATAAQTRNITLPPKGSLTGTVYLGDSSHPAGSGDVRISLEYIDPNSFTFNQQPSATVTTQAGGAYSISGLDGYTYRATYTSVSGSFAAVTGSNFIPGAITRDVVLTPLYSVGGTVFLGDSSRTATSNEVEVSLIAANGSTVLATQKTDASGGFLFTARAAGTYTLKFTYLAGPQFTTWTQPLILDANRLSEVVTVPRSNGITGFITDSSGDPVSGANVTARRWAADSWTLLASYSATTSADGSYAFANLPDGQYVISYSASGWAGGYFPDSPTQFAAERIPLSGGVVETDINGILYSPSTISGTVTGATSAELTAGNVTGALYVYNYVIDEWEWRSNIEVGSNGKYSVPGLFPYTYFVVIYYDGPRGVSTRYSDVLDLYEGDDAVFNTSLAPHPPVYPATLVQVSGSSQIYFVDGYSTLVPVISTSVATDAGASATVRVISQDTFNEFDVQSTPLTNVFICDSVTYLASGGSLHAVDPYSLDLFANLPSTVLDPLTCSLLPQGAEVSSGTRELFFGSTSSGRIYQVTPDGVRHLMIGGAFPQTTSSIVPFGQTYGVNSAFLTLLPSGNNYLAPATLVSSGGAIYLVDGTSSLVPVSSITTARDLGFDTYRIVPVTAADMLGRTVASSPLRYVINCEGLWRIGSTSTSGNGPFSTTTIPNVGGLPFTPLSGITCWSIRGPEPAYNGSPALIVRTASSPQLYYISGGIKTAVSTTSATAIAAPNPLVVTYVSAEFLASVSVAPTPVSVGMLIKSTSGSLYIVDSATRFIPVRSADMATELGRSASPVTVSPATFNGVTVEASMMSNFVSCGTDLFLVGQGKLWATTSAVVGAAAVTALSSPLCDLLPRSSTALNSPTAFVKSASTGSIFAISNGVRSKVLDPASMSRMTGGAAVAPVSVNSPFLNTLTVGADVFDPGMVLATSDGSLYLVTDTASVARLRSLDAVGDLGLSKTAYAGSLAGRSVDSLPLSNFVACGGEVLLAGQGKLWPASPDVVGATPVTVLADSLCAALPRGASALNSPVAFMKSTATGSMFAVAGGVRSKVLDSASMLRMTGGVPVQLVSVNSPFLSSLPVGSDVFDVGMTVSAGGSLYLLTGPTAAVKLRGLDVLTDLGLTPTAFAGSVAGRSIDTTPLSNVVSCAGELFIAGQGALRPTVSAVVGSLPVSVLPSEICALLARGAALNAPTAFLKSSATGSLFALTNGVRSKVLDSASMLRMTGGEPVELLSVNSPFLNTLAVGADIVDTGMTVSTADGSLYLLTGPSTAVRLRSLDILTDLGLTAKAFPGTVAGRTVQSMPLSNFVSCDGDRFVVGGGALWATTGTVTGSAPVSVLTAELCALLPRGDSTNTPAFLRSTMSGSVFAIENGVRRKVTNVALLPALAGGEPVVLVPVNSPFLNTIPAGPDITTA